jgi:hypothetical protein
MDNRVKAMSKVEGVKSLISRYEQDIETLESEHANLETEWAKVDGFAAAVIECDRQEALEAEMKVIYARMNDQLLEGFSKLAVLRGAWTQGNNQMMVQTRRYLTAKHGLQEGEYTHNQLSDALREVVTTAKYQPLNSLPALDVVVNSSKIASKVSSQVAADAKAKRLEANAAQEVN